MSFHDKNMQKGRLKQTMKMMVNLRVMMRSILNLRVRSKWVCQSDQSDNHVCAWEASGCGSLKLEY